MRILRRRPYRSSLLTLHIPLCCHPLGGIVRRTFFLLPLLILVFLQLRLVRFSELFDVSMCAY
eukprot:417117-Amphidinium_carterae.1